MTRERTHRTACGIEPGSDEIELAERLAQFYEAGRGVVADLVAFEAAGWRPDDIVTWTPLRPNEKRK